MSQFQVSNLFENINLVPREQEQRFLITLGGKNNFAKQRVKKGIQIETSQRDCPLLTLCPWAQ